MTTTRPRIAVVTTSWPRFEGDASGHFVATDARLLARCGEVRVIAPDGVEAFGWPGVAARVRERPMRAVGAAAWVARARSEVERGELDRVVAHWAVPCAWPIGVAAKGATLEVVSHGGDVRLLRRLPKGVRAHIVARVTTRAEGWRFVSGTLLDTLVAGLGARDARAVERIARVEACAIEVERPTERAIAEARARMGGPFAVCVARLVASKRVEEAIAWAEREGVALVIVGDGPERARLERAARGSAQRVEMVGRVTRGEALAWIAAAETVVQASRTEGASTVEREAEELGTRVTRV